MARYPGAVWKPLGKQTQPRLVKPRIILLHTMGGGTLESTDREFRVGGYTGLESHFGVGADGEVWQWQDTDYTADADVTANAYAWSIETEDAGHAFPAWTGSNVPAWLAPQADSIVDLVAWLCKLGDIPAVHVPDSRPGRRGIAGHRQGVNSSPAGQRGYRQPGGDLWSDVLGKVCPGDRRYAQIDSVIVPGVIAALKPPAPVVPFGGESMITLIEVNETKQRYATDGLRRIGIQSKQHQAVLLNLMGPAHHNQPKATLAVYPVAQADLGDYGVLDGPDGKAI